MKVNVLVILLTLLCLGLSREKHILNEKVPQLLYSGPLSGQKLEVDYSKFIDEPLAYAVELIVVTTVVGGPGGPLTAFVKLSTDDKEFHFAAVRYHSADQNQADTNSQTIRLNKFNGYKFTL